MGKFLTFLMSVAGCTVLCSVATGSESTDGHLNLLNLREGDDRPNIVLILADDLGFSDIAPYGSEINTPSLVGTGRGRCVFHELPYSGETARRRAPCS